MSSLFLDTTASVRSSLESSQVFESNIRHPIYLIGLKVE